MLSLQHIILLACCLISVESVILGRRRSWNWNNWGNNRRSWSDPEKNRWEVKNEGWGWNWANRWGSARSVDSHSNSDRWNSDRWSTWNSWNNGNWNTGSRWNNVRKRQRSHGRPRSRTNTRIPGRAATRPRTSTTNNAWYYQMICKNNYPPLKHANGNPYYCSWYSPCPQNGGSTYWYTYRYTCQQASEASMGLCCVDAGEVESNTSGWN